MVESSIKIQVDIGDHRYIGSDSFDNWQQSERPAATVTSISFLGMATESHVPFTRPSVFWDMIHLSADGFGVAVNHEKSPIELNDGDRFLANVLITTNHARHWQENPMRLSWGSRMCTLSSWPVEQFHSLVVTENQTVMLAWEDPWIMERARSHIVFSHNFGVKWHYRRLNQCYPYLYTAPGGQIMCFSEKRRYYSRDEGKHWHSDAIFLDVDSDRPGIGYSHIQNATFVSEQCGFALMAKYDRTIASASPEAIILLETQNNGNHWHGVAEFAFPSTSTWRHPRQVWSLTVK